MDCCLRHLVCYEDMKMIDDDNENSWLLQL